MFQFLKNQITRIIIHLVEVKRIRGIIIRQLKKKYFLIPKYDIDTIDTENTKNVLFIMPWLSYDGTSTNILAKVDELNNAGYNVFGLIYGKPEIMPQIPENKFKFIFYLQNSHPFYLNYNKNQMNFEDGFSIDQWIGEELNYFIAGISKKIYFNVVVCNYVFLSKSLELFKHSVKILDTHDVFSNRNNRLKNFLKREDDRSLFFSTQNHLEKKALHRADFCLVVTEYDRSELLDSENVSAPQIIVSPPLLPKNYLNLKIPNVHSKITIGFLAGLNSPNYKSLDIIYKLSEKFTEIDFVIAGKISLNKKNKTSNIKYIGTFSKSKDFYEQIDIAINPDSFLSGIKVKNIEALSYGIPLLCTEISARPFSLISKFHSCRDVSDFEICINELNLNKLQTLEFLRDESIKAYDSFCEKYSSSRISSIIESTTQGNLGE